MTPEHLVEICILDTRPGFTAAQIANLGAAFPTTKPDCLGIGLALSKSIVDTHGGKLWASRCLDQSVVRWR